MPIYFFNWKNDKKYFLKATKKENPVLRVRPTHFLSRLNVVQKETMWSLILYVVCVCM